MQHIMQVLCFSFVAFSRIYCPGKFSGSYIATLIVIIIIKFSSPLICRDSSYCHRLLFLPSQTCICQFLSSEFSGFIPSLCSSHTFEREADFDSEYLSSIWYTVCHIHEFKCLCYCWSSHLWDSKCSEVLWFSWFSWRWLVSLPLGGSKCSPYVWFDQIENEYATIYWYLLPQWNYMYQHHDRCQYNNSLVAELFCISDRSKL